MKCSRCRSNLSVKGLRICQPCRDYFKQWSSSRIAQDKRKCIIYYGKNEGCVCCGITQISFLSLDHIKDDGFKDHKGKGKHLYRILIKLNFPSGYQTLCFNCQWGKRLNNGFCPHHPRTDLRKKCSQK